MSTARVSHERTGLPELPALTGIRFVAASLVYLGHVIKVPGLERYEGNPFFGLAVYGVAVFFVLSGFILTYNYAGTFASGLSSRDYGHFVWGRLTKIYPLYLLTLLLCIPIQLAGGHREWSWGALAMHLSLMQCVIPVNRLIWTDQFNVPGWSVSCEMFFYLLAPLFIWGGLRASRTRPLFVLAGIASVALLLLFGPPVDHYPWPTRFAVLRVPEFLFGVVAAICFLRHGPYKGALLTVIGVVLLGVAFCVNERVPRFLQSGPLAAPGAVLLVYGLASDKGLIHRILSHRWMVLLGMASYALYLIHDPAIRICRGVLLHFSLAITNLWMQLIVIVVFFVVLQASSIFLFKMFELPTQKRLRRVFGPARRSRDIASSEPASATAAKAAAPPPSRLPT